MKRALLFGFFLAIAMLISYLISCDNEKDVARNIRIIRIMDGEAVDGLRQRDNLEYFGKIDSLDTYFVVLSDKRSFAGIQDSAIVFFIKNNITEKKTVISVSRLRDGGTTYIVLKDGVLFFPFNKEPKFNGGKITLYQNKALRL